MDKQRAIEQAKIAHEKTLNIIEASQKICDKVDFLLPKNWESYCSGEWLDFKPVYPHKASSAEFRMVCDIVEKATGKKLQRYAQGTKESHKLVGSIFGRHEEGLWFSLSVESRADDTCKITFKRTWKTEAIADPKCLGIREEAKK